MKNLLLISLLALGSNPVFAQDTFSIVAVDTLTGEIGSAGASCLDNIQFPGSGGAYIISDILPGRGAIHTQALWNATNQNNARLKMEEGLSPQEIIDWLKVNGVGGAFGIQQRQFGIVDFNPADGKPRSAGFTGTACLDWKGHKTGLIYSIQGNILLGPQILDSMEAHFLTAGGTLADRLMYALQGANVVGADTRCADDGTSSLSAFLRVAKPGDADDSLYLDLNVPSLPAGMEPIDSLQRLYDKWSLTSAPDPGTSTRIRVFPNPAHDHITIQHAPHGSIVDIYSVTGKKVWSSILYDTAYTIYPVLPAGVYFARIAHEARTLATSRFIWAGRR